MTMFIVAWLVLLSSFVIYDHSPQQLPPVEPPPVPTCGCWPSHSNPTHPRSKFLPLLTRSPRTCNFQEVDKCAVCGRTKRDHSAT